MPTATENRKSTAHFMLRCTTDDRDEFDAAAEREGFQNRTAWILYHLRRIARETQNEDQRHETE